MAFELFSIMIIIKFCSEARRLFKIMGRQCSCKEGKQLPIIHLYEVMVVRAYTHQWPPSFKMAVEHHRMLGPCGKKIGWLDGSILNAYTYLGILPGCTRNFHGSFPGNLVHRFPVPDCRMSDIYISYSRYCIRSILQILTISRRLWYWRSFKNTTW